jgi:hypothetical protein
MKELWSYFIKYWQDPWVKKGLLLFLGSFVLIQAGLFMTSHLKNRNLVDPLPNQPNFSELIPLGYTLVPLKIENEEALEALVEDYVFADLHLHSLPGAFGLRYEPNEREPGASSPSSQVIQGVKLLKKPGDKNKFSALVTQDQSSALLRPYQTIHAVITSKLNQIKKEVVTPKRFKALEGGI